MKINKFSALLMAMIMIITAVSFAGCDNNNTDNKDATTASTVSKEQQELEDGVKGAVDAIVKADKTNALEDELVKYPNYYIEGSMGFEGMDNFKKCIEENFYTVDTQYHILDVQDVTDKEKTNVEKDLKENFDVDIDIQKVAKAEIEYKYTNYSNGNIDDSDFLPTTEYYIMFDNTWYYGWGLELNAEIQEIVQ